MTAAFVRNHTAGSITSAATTCNFTLAAIVPAGNLIRVWIGFDNTSSTAPTVTGITKMAGESASWAKIASHDSSTATAAGGDRGEMWMILTTVAWSAAAYTATVSASVARIVIVVDEFSGMTTTLRGTAGAGTNGSGLPSSVTSGTAPATGDLVLGGATFEMNIAATADADTLNGSWSASNGSFTNVSSSASNISVITQYKIVTAGGQQTYNPSGASDSGCAVVALVPAPDPAITQAAASIYTDGTETGSTDLGNYPTIDANPAFVRIQVRFRLQSTSAVNVSATDDFKIQYDLNSGGNWVDCNGVQIAGYNSPNLTDGEPTTARLGAGTGSFVAGKVSEDGIADDLGWTGNNYTEVMYSLTLVGANVGNGDQFAFRVLRNSAPLNIYAQAAVINITKAAGAPVGPPRNIRTFNPALARSFTR